MKRNLPTIGKEVREYASTAKLRKKIDLEVTFDESGRGEKERTRGLIEGGNKKF